MTENGKDHYRESTARRINNGLLEYEAVIKYFRLSCKICDKYVIFTQKWNNGNFNFVENYIY